ncbi:SDR family oxidoreductase [Rhizobium ruizarguesonis]|jgi:3-oxoacyl-[acyl-carrier protein] reductase|uniref:SDR family oxidoreductase n=1 Tax=Rhizobium ruizarguesonis TaxID=2081791 RepID=A0AAE8TZM1_9HYPH|nr:SDR family NAD(P)-dependent oxidoreductase [Rhizobium ruizarguesonis]MBY5805793.1 SDR family oxidoreductase [Rhizobium leguminosarum]QIO48348.1 SDR family oxidoreductase [Rhizobium leguminosarum bv. trifolii]TBY86879.1 SDR family oxidoreductase [Rhizobium leguminosarum bv. viciae]MBY5842204.1 SDR family oxidoreductase [Rhizobium leguminosarum]MBY5887373.1 SDR family oxidoreductase [Rhizobium leguminosarum]
MVELAQSLASIKLPDLSGKAVLITGASTGIGAALARAFAAQGAKVGVHYNASREPAEKLADEIRAAGGTVHLIQGDVSREGETERVVEETAKTFGHLDGLINNAGGMLGRKPTSDYTDAHYAAVMDLNARSVLAATRAAHPWLKKQGGFIINTTSIAARNGGGNGAILYAASKGFVSTITRGHAKEFVADGIRVNAVAPGVIATPFHERYTNDEQMELQRKSIPMGFVGTSEDCVGAYLFLASPTLSGYITGQIIEVNGGQLMP